MRERERTKGGGEERVQHGEVYIEGRSEVESTRTRESVMGDAIDEIRGVNTSCLRFQERIRIVRFTCLYVI